MRTLIYTSCLLLIALLGARSSYAQVNAETRMGNGKSYWTLGLNAGFAWQDSDIRSQLGGGWGFYFGSSIYNKPNNFFSVDWRFRYMNTYTFGQNARDTRLANPILANPSLFSYNPSTSSFAHNHFTIFHDLSLEFRLNFEALRRRTNIMLSIYGGAGLGIYGTYFDQKDFGGSDYNYNDQRIDYTGSEQSIANDIVALRDEDYETPANADPDGDREVQLGIMPSVGFELGYWFSPHFALAIGHRTTFTLQENFDGVRTNNGTGIPGSIHHYTALMLHWRIYNARASISCPDVDFELPVKSGLTYTTQEPNVFVRANVRHINADQIIYTVNGTTNRFMVYNSGDNSLQGNLQLKPGENRITIRAKNSCGTDAQSVVVMYTPRDNPRVVTPVAQPPVVTITAPSQVNTTSSVNTITVRANVQYVANRGGITFSVNGTPTGNFSYNNGTFSATNVALIPGQNRITVVGTNTDGTDSKTIIVNYRAPQEPLPVVTITQPRLNPFNTENPRATVTATILNVDGLSNVQCTINGRTFNGFTFRGTSFVLNNLALQQGTNRITITGRNNSGQDSKTQIINYEPVQQVLPPVVTITQPRLNPFNTENPRATVTATILNVDGLSNVQCTVNGRTFNGFTFRGTSFVLNNLALQQGTNRITITGRNNSGQDSKTQIINYEPVQQVLPPVVTITQPRLNPFNTENPRATVTATILNVDGLSNVQCTVNGRTFNGFTFRGTSFLISRMALQRGANRITITGRNNSGQDSKTQVINYEPVQQLPRPVVTITEPMANPLNTQNQRASVSATILNVDGLSNVQCTVNGRTFNGFTFRGTNFVINSLTLQQGVNRITITGRNSAGQDSKTQVINYEPVQQLPRPVVTITTPTVNPYNTDNSRGSLTANILHVSSASDVQFTVNGRSNRSFSFTGTHFSASNIALNPGSNTLVVTGRNPQGQDSKSVVVIYNQVQELEPSVQITNPSSTPYTSPSSVVTINATIRNVSSRNDVAFTVNGRSNTNFSFNGTSFVATGVNLNAGNNVIVVSGSNSTGTAQATTTLIYQPVQPPVVQFVNPNTNPYTVANDRYTIRARVDHVDRKSDVNFTINGQATTSFNFVNNQLTATNVVLNPGSNTFTVTGRNSAGQDSKSTVILYRKRVQPPTVTITIPNRNPTTVQTATTNIAATITNIANRNEVTFTVNGRTSTGFSFSGTNFTANNVGLNEGNNTFVITARNEGGQASQSTVVVYEVPVEEPMVQITTPAQNPYSSTQGTTTINATIRNVNSRSDVTFMVNGRSNTNFSFNGTQFVANNVALDGGSNNVVITGSNSSGTAQDTRTITYRAPKPPFVTITAPSANPLNTQTNKVTINALVDYVTSASDITFTVNGRQSTDFTFSGRNFTATNVPLNAGANTFQITGRNATGQHSANTTVVYTPMLPRPTVTITAPSGSPATSSLSVANVTATVTNVRDRSGITVSVNGRSIDNFLFRGTTVQVTNLVLSLGNNSVIITGTNRSGSASDSKVIVYNSIRNPRGSGSNGQSQTGPGSTGGSGGVNGKGSNTVDDFINGGDNRSGSVRTPNGSNANQQGGGTSGGSGGLNRPRGSKKRDVNSSSSDSRSRVSDSESSNKKGKKLPVVKPSGKRSTEITPSRGKKASTGG